MTGEITKIDGRKKNEKGDVYIRIYFKMENREWAKTDLVCWEVKTDKPYRNYSRWKRILRVGNILRNLKMKDEITVDADSYPQLAGGKLVGSGQKLTLRELSKMGVFG